MAKKYIDIIEKLSAPNGLRSPNVLNEAQLNKIETQLDYVLPADYREFLRDYGGAVFDRVVFPMSKGSTFERMSIHSLFGSDDEQTLADFYFERLLDYESPDEWEGSDPKFEWFPGIHLVRDCPTPTRNINWPKELLPIGLTQGNNDICLAMFGLRPNAIFWMRNNPREGQPNIYLVADSFDEFMHLLSREG